MACRCGRPCGFMLLVAVGILVTDLGYLGLSSTTHISQQKGTNTTSQCPEYPPGLVGQQTIDKHTTPPTNQQLALRHYNLNPGGTWSPSNCQSRHHVAIIVPYRRRPEQLRRLLDHLHPFLQRQQLQYGIYVIEQDDATEFNRGMLFNIGYHEAMLGVQYQCVVLHDVDLLPENDHNLYSCPQQPTHMSVAVDTLNYRLPYNQLFGGVVAFSREQYSLVNGFSNLYFGWGGEDDDLYRRVTGRGLRVVRPAAAVARYTMQDHQKQEPNPARLRVLSFNTDQHVSDGLNSLGGTYQTTLTTHGTLCTCVSVSIRRARRRNKLHQNYGRPFVTTENLRVTAASGMNTITKRYQDNVVSRGVACDDICSPDLVKHHM